MTDIVESVMTSPTTTVPPETSLGKVMRIMVEKEIGSAVVVDGGKPVGIFTERDALRVVSLGPSTYDRPVGEFMSKNLILISPGTHVITALEIMTTKNIRRLPVVSNGKLVGIVDERDIAGWILKVGKE